MRSRQLHTEQLDAADPKAIARAAEILREGGTVAFPTETVYGLGANALAPEAVARIFAAKDRPFWDPLIVHVSDRTMLDLVAQIHSDASPEVGHRIESLIANFWPGPLTLLLPRTANVPDTVTASRPLVGARMPAHPVAAALIREAGIPIAAPSANRFGRTSPTTAAHVLHDLDHRVDAILDGGPTSVGVESTVLDPTRTPMLIYRPGAITAEMIEPVAGPAVLYHFAPSAEAPQSLPSPGVGIRHYAPRARLVLTSSPAELYSTASALTAKGERVGVMLPTGWPAPADAATFAWGNWHSPETLAQNLFAGLRALDAGNVTAILCPLPEATGVGLAIRDRLQKAARPK
jgi:L-threonylcarbamoyladenylate synthase